MSIDWFHIALLDLENNLVKTEYGELVIFYNCAFTFTKVESILYYYYCFILTGAICKNLKFRLTKPLYSGSKYIDKTEQHEMIRPHVYDVLMYIIHGINDM